MIGVSSKSPHKVGCDSEESGHQKARGGPFECELENWDVKTVVLEKHVGYRSDRALVEIAP